MEDFNDTPNMIFQQVYYVLIIIFLTEMIAVNIIDTFKQLRLQNALIGRDMKERCYVCGETKK